MADGSGPCAVLYPGDGAPDNAVLRCLGEAGVPVAIASPNLVNANAVSRYCRRWFRVPVVERGCAAVLDRLDRIAEELGGRPVFFPLHDFAVLMASEHRERLSRHYRGDFLDKDLAELCNRHERMYATAMAAGVPAPVTVSGADLMPGEIGRVSLPCVVKPDAKYVVEGDSIRLEPFLRKFGRKGIIVGSGRELRDLLGRCADAAIPVVVQEYVPGPVSDLINVVLHVADGRVSASFAGRKVRQGPGECGTCTFGESCLDADDCIGLAERLVTSIGYHGIAEVEFKRDRRDGRPKLVELNPRATVFCSLAAAHGINLPLMAYTSLTTGSAPSAPLRVGKRVVRWMDPYRDLLQARGASPLHRVRDLCGADLLCWGGRRDPLPLLVAPVQGIAEWLADRLRPAVKRPPLGAVKAPGDSDCGAYWSDRSRRPGLSSVMWSSEDYNVLADARQKKLADEALGDVRGKRVLDLCCGTGRVAVHVARRGADVVGLDLACMAEAAEKANPHPRVSYVGANVESMDFPPGTFDAVLSVGSLPCVCDTAEQFDRVIERVVSVLKPGGLLVLMEPFHVCPGLRRPLSMSPGAALSCIERAGLRLVGKKALLFLPFWLFMARAWWRAPRRVTAGLFKLGELVLRIPGTSAASDYKMFVLAKENE